MKNIPGNDKNSRGVGVRQKTIQEPLTGALPMTFFQTRPAESGGLAFLCSACYFQQVFVDEALRQHRHYQVTVLPTCAPNLPAQAPACVEIGPSSWTHRD